MEITSVRRLAKRLRYLVVLMYVVTPVGEYVYGERFLSVESDHVTVPSNTRPSDLDTMELTLADVYARVTAPEDGWIISFEQEIHGAPEAALRFSWVFDMSQRDPYCGQVGRIVFVMSFEKVPVLEFPSGHGYGVSQGDEIVISGGFANFSSSDYPDAHIKARVGFVSESEVAGLDDVYPVFLNAECKNSLFAIPPLTTVERRLPHPFRVPFDGRIILLASHAHRYATDIVLTLNREPLWRTSPVSLPDGTNYGNPIFLAPYNGVPVSEGDLLDLHTTYVNQGDRRTDAMSSMYIQIVSTPKPEYIIVE